MEKILYLAHSQEDGSLPKAAYETLNAALNLATDLGGAALTRAYVEDDCVKAYECGNVAYARDAFDGLKLMDQIATGRLDSDDWWDVIAVFSGQGLWQKIDLGGWTQLNGNSPDDVVTADVTGNGQDDIVADFGTTTGGLFIKRDQGAWVKQHNTSPDSMAPGELDD